MITSTDIFQTRADTRYRHLDGEGIVVNQKMGEVIVINEIGARVLDLLASATSFNGLLKTLGTEYTVDPLILEHDVRVYLQELMEAEVIERVTD